MSGEESPKSEFQRTGGKSRSRVSFVDSEPPPRDEAATTRLDLIKLELEKMKQKDEIEERRYKEKKENEIAKLKAQYTKDRIDKGIQLYPNVRESKQAIAGYLEDEVKHLMQEERTRLGAETAKIKNEISLKYGLHIKKKNTNLVKMASEFVQPAKASNEFGLPLRIVKELTVEETLDLKQVFDLHDVAGVGYIRAKDVRKIGSLLGFRIAKDEFKSTMNKLTKKQPGKVTFPIFLDFIIKYQEGGDPFDEIQQVFKMLDVGDKGYVTFSDIRQAADETDCPLSNRMIRGMLDEADSSGDGMISIDEFTMIMLRTSAFRSL